MCSRVLVALLCLCVLPWADDCPAQDVAATKDPDAEPLPQGALRRLGTKLLRHPGRGGHAVSWSPDGKTLAYVGYSGGVYLADGDTGKLRLVLPIPDGFTSDLAFSPDGKELACGSRVDGVTFYDPATGKPNQRPITAGWDWLKYSSRGTYFAAASGGDFRVMSRDADKIVLDVKTHAEINGLSFTDDEKYLLVSSLHPAVSIWDIAQKKVVKRWSDEPEGEEQHFVMGAAPSPGGVLFAACATDIAIVDIKTMKQQFRLAGDSAHDLFLHAEFTPDGKRLVAVSQEGPIYVWNVAEQKQEKKLHAGAWAVRDFALRSDGRRAAIVDYGNRVWVWDLEQGRLLFDDRPGHTKTVHIAAFSPDGAMIATGSGGKDTHLWDARTGEHIEKIPASSSFLKFTSNEQLLTSWIYSQQLVTWQVDPAHREKARQTSEAAFEEKQRENPPAHHLALSANQNRLLRLIETADERNERSWSLDCLDFPSLTSLQKLKLAKFARAIAVSSDGSLAAFPVEEDVQLFDLAASKAVSTIKGAEVAPDQIVFTPDDKRLVFGGCDRTVYVWDVDREKMLHELKGVGRSVAAIAISQNGRVVAAGGHDRCRPGPNCPRPEGPSVILLWDITSGERLATLEGCDSSVHALAFSPDGKLLVSGLEDSTALVWQTPEAAWSK